MRQTVILVATSDRYPMFVLDVENYDDHFPYTLAAVEAEWHKTEDEYSDFVLPRLRERGYIFENVEDYAVVDVGL